MNNSEALNFEEMKTNFGMWLFLASEVLIFGVLITLFELNYKNYAIAFKEASHEIHFVHGTVNTVVLLTSSYFVALGLHSKKRIFILLSMLLGLAFLGIKATEYIDLTREGKFIFGFAENVLPEKKLFFTFYGFMTLLHALHLIFGVFLLGIVWWAMKKNEHEEFAENVGLYWHFVDLVWVYLYPMFYLLGH